MNVLLILFFLYYDDCLASSYYLIESSVCACVWNANKRKMMSAPSIRRVCLPTRRRFLFVITSHQSRVELGQQSVSFFSFLCFFLFFFVFFSRRPKRRRIESICGAGCFFFLSICVLSLFYFVSFLFFSRVCPPSLRVWSVVIESVIERRFLLPTAPDCWGRLEIDVWRRLYSFTGFYRVFFSSASLAASIIWSMLIESVIDCWSLLWIHLWWHLYSFIWLLKFALNWCSMALIESLDWIELVFSFWSHLIAEVCSWLILDGVCAVEPDCWSLLLIDVRLRQYSFTGFLPSLFFFSHSHCFHVWSVSIEFVIEVVFCWWSYLIAEVGTLWGSLITGFYRVFISAAVRWPLLLLSPLIGMRFNP